jgi:hypothetical protein
MRRWSLRSAVLVLATVLVTFSCDRSPNSDTPLSPPASGDLLGLPKLRIIPRDTAPERVDTSRSDAPRPLIFVQEDGPSKQEFTSGIFGVLGGVLSLAGHSVDVPRGAVLEPTLFTMLTPATPVIDVELNALVPAGLRALLRTVGLFRQPVTLELSYARAKGEIDPDHLVVVRLLDDGTFEILPTQVDKRRKVIRAELDHFSKYAMASN